MRTWITITPCGATAGVVAASLTYATAQSSSRVLSNASYYTVGSLGHLLASIATYFGGEPTGIAIRISSDIAKEYVCQSVHHGGTLTAAGLAVTAGAVTALSITLGTYAVEYSIEYGGKLTKEAALAISEAYLKYKSVQTGFVEKGDVNLLVEDDWLLVEG